jgi:predicted nucleic acid-binding protein
MVVDASLVIEALVSGGRVGDRARELMANAAQLAAPHLLDVEVVSGVRRLQAGRAIEVALASAAIGQLGRMPIDRFPHRPFLDRMWALRNGLSAYDAAYIALAEAVDRPLATLDARLAKAPGIACDVVVLV